MIIAFNIAVILLVLLIAYWWANQGLLSAMLHLLCVIMAGALALAFWEPITVNLLLRGNAFDDYAWGITLVGLFVVFLLLFRLASDKIVRANLDLPQWANLTFGSIVGAAAGIITMGIVLIGAGFVQSYHEIAEYRGYARGEFTGQVEYVGPRMWVPVHHWTAQFYQSLSVGALHPDFTGTPLLHYNPDLHKQATLLRDGYARRNVQAKFSLEPDAATIRRVQVDESSNRYAVEVEFGPTARDSGSQLTLSSAQVRLICPPRGNRTATPAVVHPDAWRQEVEGQQGMRRFHFDDVQQFITSVPGQQRTRAIIEFPVPQNQRPSFIQIRGTRFALPEAEPVPAGSLGTGLEFASNDDRPSVDRSAQSINQYVDVSNRIDPIVASINRLPGTIQHRENYLTQGHGDFRSRGERPSRALRVRGIEETPGTRIVQVEIARNLPTDIFGDLRRTVGREGQLFLVDDRGNRYQPMGYIHQHRDGNTVWLQPTRLIDRVEDIPMLPAAGTERLRLIFRVTEGVRIIAFQYGDVTVGQCNVLVEGNRR